MIGTRTPVRGLRAAALALAALLATPVAVAPPATAAPPAGSGEDAGIPQNGLDRILLKDGRVVQCKVGEKKGEKVVLEFPSVTLEVDRVRIEDIKLFEHYDSTPRDDSEKEKVERGLVRWDGRWIAKARAEAILAEEAEKQRKKMEEDEFRSKWENRWIVDTEYFHIEANIPKERLDFYVKLFEDFYSYFIRAFQIRLTQRDRKQKLPVYIYRRRAEYWKHYEVDTGGQGENTLGYFVPKKGEERLVFQDAGSRQETIDVMFHEATHSILHLANPQVLLSRWIHEGCAEYFGGSTYDGKKFIPGRVQDDRLLTFQEMIVKGKTLPTDQLMKAATSAADEKYRDFRHLHYAQAWTTVHYLMEGRKGKYRSGFVNYLGKWLGGRGVKYQVFSASDIKYIEFEESERLLLQSIGMKDFEQLEKEVQEYAKTLPLGSARGYVDRGEWKWLGVVGFEKDAEAAQADWKAAEEMGADDPAVLSRLGFIYSAVGRAEDGRRLYERAMALDPLNAEYRYHLARFLPDAERLRHLRACVEIDPGYAPALGDLARETFQRTPDRNRYSSEEELAALKEAILHAEKAITIDPVVRHYATLAMLALAAGDFDKARSAAKTATELEPDNEDYLWMYARSLALLGEPTEFAKILRRIELLLRRGSMPRDGETAREGAYSPEQIGEVMGRVVRGMVEVCLRWERVTEAAQALDAWHLRRPPKTEDDWYYYARVMVEKGDGARAAEIAAKGLEEFPDSTLLKTVQGMAADLGRGGGLGSDGE